LIYIKNIEKNCIWGQNMKKSLPFMVIGILILSGFGAVAINSDNEKLGLKAIEYKTPVREERDFTHNVLVEYGTTRTCPYCPAVSGYLNDLYNSGEYDFYFVTLNTDCETLANSRYWELPAGGYVPTVWFDGGYSYLIGDQGSKTPYIDGITSAGARNVADIDLELSVEWLGDAEMKITASATNKEGSGYSGHFHTYITEIVSRWYDNSGKKYHYSMIGYAINKNINVAGGNTWSETVTWDGDSYGYGDIQENNILVIASSFDSGTKYVDETIGATPGTTTNNPPGTPSIDGPTSGNAKTSYTYTFNSVDPDGDDVYYYIKWGDSLVETWVGPHASGTDFDIAHTYTRKGTYTIEAKAKDSKGAESGWNTLIVTMPKNKAINKSFQNYIQSHPNLFLILQKMIKRLGL
jgi:hypothetical protein